MKAVRLVRTGQPLELQDVPVPLIGPHDMLVRVESAGVCHSDVHYRAGISPVFPLPLTLGHEVAGVVEEVGSEVTTLQRGDRVALHYLVTCGDCEYCVRGNEQFCTTGRMIGKHLDGGLAEYISHPARAAFRLPEEIPFEQGAIMMCSSATAFHALKQADIQPGDRVAVFGAGGLGMSAIQLAGVFGALDVYAIDIDDGKLKLAEQFGAIPIDNRHSDAAEELRRLTAGRGVDVAIELIGLPATIKQALAALAVFGRLVLVGLSDEVVEVDPYNEIINREARLIGCSDHLAQELPTLIELVRRRRLDLAHVITRTAPLDAGVINDAMDRMERYEADGVRLVITPNR